MGNERVKKMILDTANKYGANVQNNSEHYVPEELQKWLESNKNNPFYAQAQAIANREYVGPGTSPMDFIYGLFGDTPYEQGLSQYKQYQNDAWTELLGKINEYEINLPANLAKLQKQAGYNVDLTGETQPMNLDTDNPINVPDYTSIQGGREMLGTAVGTFSGIVKDALGLYTTNVNLKNLSLNNEALELGNLKLNLDNDEKEMQLGNLAKGYALSYGKSKLQDGTFATPLQGGKPFEEYVVGMSLGDFIQKGFTNRGQIADEIIHKIETENFPFTTYSTRNKKRFLDQLKAYIHSDEFATDIYNTYANREKAFQNAVKTASQPIGESTGSLSFSEGLEAFQPLYKLEMKALEGDYKKRQYNGDREEILFNKEKFEYDMQATMREVLSEIKTKADTGDEFSKYLLFTMVTNPQYFEEINKMASGVSDFLTDLNPIGGISKLFKGIGKKAKKAGNSALKN